MTGVGYPHLSAIIECADAAHGLRGHVCADGGCRSPGDVAKAFAAGADFVMLGGMLAGHDDPPLRFAPKELALEPGDLPVEVGVLRFEDGNALPVLSPLSLGRLAFPQQRDDLCGTRRSGLVFQPHVSLVSHLVPLPKGNALAGQTAFRLTTSSGCIICHTLPAGLGTDMRFNGFQWQQIPLGSNVAHHIAMIELERSSELPFKVPSLRNLFDKFGMDLTRTNSRSGFGFTDFPRLFSRQVFETQFARGQKNSRDALLPFNMKANRSAATDAFIIRVRSENENVHCAATGSPAHTFS